MRFSFINGCRRLESTDRTELLVGAAIVALFAGAAPVHAQVASTTETVVVSATRLTTAGFDAPTPTQVVGLQQLQDAAHPNIYDTVAQLPALEGSRSTGVGNGNNSNGLNGMSVLNMRALSPIRTLTMVDGQRIAPANINGVADVSLLPQLLIQRVDVVTGGASASWGSDAVAGVVNFITDKTFEGVKANLQGGITNYGDDASVLAQAAWGAGFLNDRLHVEASVEYYRNQGVPSRPYGDNGGPNGRKWWQAAQIATRTVGATPAGQPENMIYAPGQNKTYALGGLITKGPLAGTAFGPGGTPYQFQFGTNCIGSICQGGDNTSNVSTSNAWDAKLNRTANFARISYDITNDFNIYTTQAYAEVRSVAQVNQGAAQQGNLTIQCDNAFLPQSIKDACVADGITNFAYGVSNLIFPASPGVDITRKQYRTVLGFEDKRLDLFGSTWNLQGYYQHGELHENLKIPTVMLTPRYKAAIDAITVTSANIASYPGAALGQIVCRNTAAYSSGCVPWNAIGINPVNMASWNYITPKNGPFQNTTQHEEVASFSISGAPFQNWAGDVSVAFGGEWREEAYHANADWYGAGLSAQSPITAEYPYDPIIPTTGSNYYAGSFYNGHGIYNVKETFLEVGMPLFDSANLGKMAIDLGGRFAHYSTSGDVETWKAGGTWDTPIDGIRLRAVASRDVRAPNLSELSPPTLSSNFTATDRTTGNLVNVAALTMGNPNLKPEKSDNIEAGIVYQPDYIPGFQASFDYFSIRIKGGIYTSTPQQVVDLCQISHNADACANVKLTGALGTSNPPYINVVPINLASIYTSGFDLVAGYNTDLEDYDLPGSFNIVARATHVNTFVQNTGIPNAPILHYAGNNSSMGTAGFMSGDYGSAPKWKGLITETWAWGKVNLSAVERFVSSGHVNPDWIQCQAPNCPVPTDQHQTINYNNLPAALYVDLGASYEFLPGTQAYAKIENIGNVNPPMYGASNVYDYLGRVYRVGIRYSMQ